MYSNWSHPNVFDLITQDQVQSKHNWLIVNYKCGDIFRLTESPSGQSLSHIYGTSSESAHFWDPKKFTKVTERSYRWGWYYYNNSYLRMYLCVL